MWASTADREFGVDGRAHPEQALQLIELNCVGSAGLLEAECCALMRARNAGQHLDDVSRVEVRLIERDAERAARDPLGFQTTWVIVTGWSATETERRILNR